MQPGSGPESQRANSGSSESTAPNISMPKDSSLTPTGDRHPPSFTEQLLSRNASDIGSYSSHNGFRSDDGAANCAKGRPSHSNSGKMRPLAAFLNRKQPLPAAHAKDHFRVPEPTKLASPGNELEDRRRLFEYRDIYAGSVFFAPHWERYSTWRRFAHIFSPRVCYKVLLAILPAMLVVTISTVACALYQGMRPASTNWPDLQDADLQLPYACVSFALSLLLVFKTNTCYARFWEGADAALLQCCVCTTSHFALTSTCVHHLHASGTAGA